MASSGHEMDVLTDVARERARAEARELTAMLRVRDAEVARTAAAESPRLRQVQRAAVALAIGEAMRLSEGQVVQRLSFADTVRDQAPTVWEAFEAGLIDMVRVRDIASTIDQLQRAESVHRLERLVVLYAVDHTSAELRVWLRRFVQRVEADLAVERAESCRRDRNVSVRHDDDSMSWLSAYLPSHVAAAIESRLHREARKPAGPDDDRTVVQREADLLAAWCTNSEAATAAVDANVAVMVDADVLAGAVAGFAESADGRWAVPARWVAEVTAGGSAFWHRIVREPVSGDILSHEYIGRFCPDLLNVALRFLHGTCQSPGCMVPAELCDMDHRKPFPQGGTRADNLGPFCRRHHIYKGHGLLHWSTRQAA